MRTSHRMHEPYLPKDKLLSQVTSGKSVSDVQVFELIFADGEKHEIKTTP